MKRKIKICVISSKLKSLIVSIFFCLGLLTESAGQLQSYLNNVHPGQDFYYIQNKSETYLDSIEITGLKELPLPCPYNTQDLVISEDTTWNTFIRMDRDVLVDSGAVLTIASGAEIAFPDNAKITVLPGGKLVLDGGTLTNLCYHMWKGVEVWGDPALAQNPANQGILVIINGSIIENALVAVRLGKTIVPDGGGGEISYGNGGGLIFAANANFRNNCTGVAFEAYPNNNISYFNRCTFETTKQLPDDKLPQNLLVLNSVVGIDIKGCTFQFSGDMITQYTERGNGIYSFNSSFTVDEICTSGTTPCTAYQATTFNKLNYGIKAYGISTSRSCSVTNSNFAGNKRGVYLSGISLPGITSNEFTVLSDTIDAYGLYLDQCNAYCVENNYLISPNEGSSLGIGLIVNQSGGEPNEIYRNTFERVEYGILAQNENRDARSGTGLVLKCNQYDDCSYDHVVTWDGLFMNQSAGIAESQGSSSSNAEGMAGNLFHIPPGPVNDDFDDINNEANHITYYYPENYTDSDVEPVDYTENTVTLDGEVIVPNDWTFEDGCPPSEEPGGGGAGETRGKMESTELKIDSTQNLLILLVDGGNTENLQTNVDNSAPPETMQVYTDLMNKSPYLSDTVVSTAILKEEVLPGAMIRDIMVANPNTAKSGELMNKLDERLDPLPGYMKAQILAGRSIVSIREETESRLAAFKLQRAKHFNALQRYYLNDTIDPEASVDSFTLLLHNENNLKAKYQLAFLEMEMGEWAEGLAVLNSIPEQFELSSEEILAHSQITSYYSLLHELAQQGNNVSNIDSTQISSLAQMQAYQSSMAGVYARNILLALNLISYDEPILLPDLLKSAEAMNEYRNILSKANDAPARLKAQPNPARDYIIVEYELEKEIDALIEVRNLAGLVRYSKSATNQQDQFTIDTRNWKAGFYIATLTLNGRLVESVKFTVID